jgi:hypothetical protein
MLEFRRRLVPSAGSLLALLVAVGQPHHLAAQAIRGSIRDTTTGRAVSSARVVMLDRLGDTVATVVSLADGTFSVTAPQWGEFIIYIRRLGYRPLVQAPVELHTAETLDITYHLQPLPVPLNPVIVEAEAVVQYAYVRYLQKEGFYRRHKSTYGGRFLDPVAIERRMEFVRRADEFLLGQAMVMGVVGTSRGYRLRCGKPKFFIDDRLFIGDDLDQAIDPEAVLAIEIYDGARESDFFYGNCAVVVWTRSAAEEEMGGR